MAGRIPFLADGEFDGKLLTIDGNAATPSYTYTTDETTGESYILTDGATPSLLWSTEGIERIRTSVNGTRLDVRSGHRLESNGTFESGISDWSSVQMEMWNFDDGDATPTNNWEGTNATITQASTPTIFNGSLCVAFDGSATPAQMEANSPTGLAGVPVSGATDYLAIMFTLAGTTARNVNPQITWYDSGGTFISTSSGEVVQNSTSSWTQLGLTAESPPTAAYASIGIYIDGPVEPEVHYVDIAVFVGGSYGGAASLAHSTSYSYTPSGSLEITSGTAPIAGVYNPSAPSPIDATGAYAVLPGEVYQASFRYFSPSDSMQPLIMCVLYDQNMNFLTNQTIQSSQLAIGATSTEWQYQSVICDIAKNAYYLRFGIGWINGGTSGQILHLDDFQFRRVSSLVSGHYRSNVEGSAVHIHSEGQRALIELHPNDEGTETPSEVHATSETLTITSPAQAGSLGNNYDASIELAAGTDVSTATVTIDAATTVNSDLTTAETLTAQYIRIPYNDFFGEPEASLSSTTHQLQIGATNTTNMIFDDNEIMVRNNGAAANIYINLEGGRVSIGAPTANARLHVVADDAGTVGLEVQAASGQTANIQEWSNSSGTNYWVIQSSGTLYNSNQSAGTTLISVRASGDTNTRFLLSNSGAMSWGSGSAAVDTNLYRNSVDTLKTDDSFVVSIPSASNVGITIDAASSQSANLQEWRDNTTANLLVVGPTGDLTFSDAVNMITGTTTGTEIATSASQKLGFWGVTPVAQQSDWNVLDAYTKLKEFDPNSYTTDELARVLASLIEDFRLTGILGPGYVPPMLGWTYFYTAESMTGGGAAATNWGPTVGNATLTKGGTPTVETDANFGGKNYVKWSGTSDYFYTPDVSSGSQPFVIVMYARVSGVPSSGVRKIVDSYTDGTAPTNRVLIDYNNTIIDQQRINATNTVQSNWASDYTEKLWEITFDGASSTWDRDGVNTLSGNAGTNTMDGLVLGALYDITSQGNDKLEIAYMGLIPQANWASGRAAHVAWHNQFYSEDAV